jgi:hypothetical protein
MFQLAVKLAFVKRYCNPQKGWEVFVDIDPSEEGRTGGGRKTPGREDAKEGDGPQGQPCQGGA